MALVVDDIDSIVHILKINEIKILGKEQSEMEENNKLSININDSEGISKVANALANISEMAVMFLYEVSKYGELDDVEMEIREKAFSRAINGVFKSLFGSNDANAVEFIKMYEQIMEKKIDEVSENFQQITKNMFDLNGLSDIVNPN